MTFDKPIFVKPDSATIENLDYWDIFQGGLKIGVMMKVKGMVYLDVMYNKYEFKASEKSRILFTINLEYSRAFLHVVGSVRDCNIEHIKNKMDELNRVNEYKFRPYTDFTIKE